MCGKLYLICRHPDEWMVRLLLKLLLRASLHKKSCAASVADLAENFSWGGLSRGTSVRQRHIINLQWNRTDTH
jgi:hypothetical protein